MPTVEQPIFTLVNYELCNYCQNQAVASHRDGSREGCGLVRNDQGQYARLTFMEEELNIINDVEPGMAINSLLGCQRFKSNGLPAHPIVKKELVIYNRCASTIPEDSQATETGWEFSLKRDKFTKIKIPLFKKTFGGMLQPTIR